MTYQIISERKVRNQNRISNPHELFYILKRYANSKKEQFILITLDAGHTPIRIIILGIGTLNRAIIHPRDIFYYAIKDMAFAVMVCHNHPSGTLIPSEEDLNITNRLIEAGDIIGIPVIDHLIINKSNYFSFRKENIIGPNYKYVHPTSAIQNEWKNKYS